MVSPSKAVSLKRKFDASDDPPVRCSMCMKWLRTSAFPVKNGRQLKTCMCCLERAAKKNAKTSARKHEQRLTAAANHSVLRGPLRNSADIEAIAGAILLSSFFTALQSTPASVLIFATAQVSIGSPINDALGLILQEGLNSFSHRAYYLPKVVTAACQPVAQSIVKATGPVLRVLFISDRVDHVSSGKYGVEAAVMRKLFTVNDPDGGRLLNKNPDAKHCNARPGYFGIVAALVFPNGIEGYGWHVQRQGTVVPYRVPVPSLVLPKLTPSPVLASSFDSWLSGDGETNEAMLRNANEAYAC